MRVLAGNPHQDAANGASRPDAGRLSLVKGQPTQIALKFRGAGKSIARTGNVMYTLHDGRVGFFPPQVAAEIDSLNLAPGEPFVICHHGGADWEIERVAPPQPNAAAPSHQAPPRPVASSSSQLSQSTTVPPAKVNGQGEDAAAILARCYHQAIAIALEAVEAARGKGLMVSPTFEDLRAMAATLHICETGGRR